MAQGRDEYIANGEIRDIIQRLARIEQQLLDWPRPDASVCAVHGQRLLANEARLNKVERSQDDIKDTIGKRNMVAGVISASVTGLIFMVKYMVGK